MELNPRPCLEIRQNRTYFGPLYATPYGHGVDKTTKKSSVLVTRAENLGKPNCWKKKKNDVLLNLSILSEGGAILSYDFSKIISAAS